MFGNLTGWHLLVLLAVIILLFGAAKLPALAKSMGQSARVLKTEMRAMKDEDKVDDDVAPTPVATSASSAPSRYTVSIDDEPKP